MKLQEYTFSQESRKDLALVDFINDVSKIINLGRYQLKVVSTVPTYTGDEGELVLYISGTIRRLYFYDITNGTWHFAQWGAAGSGQTTVVASASLIGQTADIATTTLYTPSGAGTFRMNVYMICTTAGGGALTMVTSWTDLVGAKSIATAGSVDLASTANGSTGQSFLVSGASAITFATSIAGKTGSPQYAFYAVLEALT